MPDGLKPELPVETPNVGLIPLELNVRLELGAVDDILEAPKGLN